MVLPELGADQVEKSPDRGSRTSIPTAVPKWLVYCPLTVPAPTATVPAPMTRNAPLLLRPVGSPKVIR